MALAPTDLLLPPALDRTEVVALLEERLALDAGRPRTVDRVLLDSFDGRLRAAGLLAERSGGELTLHEAGAPVRRGRIAGTRRHLVSDLAAGPVRERLAGVLEERALLPAVRVRSSVQPLAVLDGEGKTVVRLAVEYPEAVVGRSRAALAPRLSVQPVLGYDREYDRALSVLRGELGLEVAERPLFDDALIAAGGRPEGVSSKPRIALEAGTRADAAEAMVLRQLLTIAVANLPGAQDDLDPEFLHDLRVSIRRARSVLRELKAVNEPVPRAHLREELKWAQAMTGPVRDLDVQLLEWDELVGPLAPERAAELEPLRAILIHRRARELTRLRRGLRSARFAATLDAWERLATLDADGAGSDAGVPIDVLAGARIRSVHRRMVRDGRRIDDDSPPEALHELRKRGKELRYLLELFGGPFPRGVVKPMVSTLKDLQDVLGRFQDRTVQTEMLRALRHDLAAEPEGPAALIALGPALELLLADQRLARDEFAERFAAFASKEQRKLVRDTFSRRRG